MYKSTSYPLEQGTGVWIVVPTYNECDNIARLVGEVLAELPAARVLVVDDNSPDGTGELALEMARVDERVHVLRRSGKQGLGVAYRAGFARALSQTGCRAVIQMDCDFSHEPSALPMLLETLENGVDLAIGSRYVPGGSTPGWNFKRRTISRAGSLFARTVLRMPFRDLTGGFKAWRADLLGRVALEDGYASGYGFQIEMTWRAHRLGASVAEVPITFRDRVAGESKMTGSIIREALLMVLRLRWRATLLGRSRA